MSARCPDGASTATTQLALIDIGSDSTRLLRAELRDGHVCELERSSEITRLAEGVERAGRLDRRAIARTEAALEQYAGRCPRTAQRHAYLTSAVREAADGRRFAARIGRRFGLTTHLLSGAREAELTYAGALHPIAAAPPVAVVDLGGGSTEVIVGGRDGVSFCESLPIGVVRHTERHLRDDPPTAEQARALLAEIRRTLRRAVPPEVRARVAETVAVASPESWLAASPRLLGLASAPPGEPPRIECGLLERAFAAIVTMPLARLERLPALGRGRAPTLAAGCAVLLEAARAFGVPEVVLSPGDLLTGAALALAGTTPRERRNSPRPVFAAAREGETKTR